ncbi:MAG: hypothetical protein NVS3B12_27640 [Acidimicrobiales bacterium]
MSQSTDLREALTAAGASPLVPKIISPMLTELQRRYSPVMAAIPSIKWGADSFYWNSRVSNPNGGFVIDGGARVVSNSSYVQNSFQMKHLQIVGAITGYAENVATVNGDLRGLEIRGSIQGLMWDTEQALLWGNAGATQFGAYPQFDGLDSQINTYSGSNQNCLNKAGGSLTLAYLDELADMVETNAAMDVFNSSWMFVMSNTAVSKMAQLLTNQQRFVDQVEVAAGLLVPSYRGIPLVKSSMLSTRSFNVGTVTATAAGTGSSLTATAQYYKVSAIFARSGESIASAEATTTPTAGQNITLAFTAPTGQDGLQPTLYKVYRGTATGAETLLGVVDATVGLSSDGVTPVQTTSIVDTGVTLIPQNGTTQPGTYPATYQGGNTNKVPATQGVEPIYLMSRDPNFIVRPYVREAEPRDIFPTTSSPDSLPYALVTDTCLAVRAPRFLGQLTGVSVAV